MSESLKKLRVVDSSCTSAFPVRKHDISYKGEIMPITFEYGKEVILPYEIGIKFSAIEGFSVFEDGSQELIQAPSLGENSGIVLGQEEVVAKLDELTDVSLKMRAAVLLGGEDYISEDVTREAVIAFLKTHPAILARNSVPDMIDDDVEDTDISQEIEAQTESFNLPSNAPIPDFKEEIIFDDESAIQEV